MAVGAKRRWKYVAEVDSLVGVVAKPRVLTGVMIAESRTEALDMIDELLLATDEYAVEADVILDTSANLIRMRDDHLSTIMKSTKAFTFKVTRL